MVASLSHKEHRLNELITCSIASIEANLVFGKLIILMLTTTSSVAEALF